MTMRIAQALRADSWGEIDDKSLERGIGGREGAMIHLSHEWAKMGHQVTNFVNISEAKRIYVEPGLSPNGTYFYPSGGYYEFVPYKLATTCMATFEYDACIAWECPDVFAHERVVEKNPIRLIEMQCAHLPAERKDAAAEFATGIVGLSQWAVDFLEQEGVQGPLYVLPNGVDLRNFPRKTTALPRNRRFVYTSSPDRGLWNLLRAWPLFRERWPEAELKVAYGVERYLAAGSWSHNRIGEMAVEIAYLLRQDGVESVGQVSQREVAKLHRWSSALAYPCDTIQPTETGCITVIEAMAAGKPVITTDCDCLEDEFEPYAMICPLPFDGAQYVDSVANVLEDRDLYMDLSAKGREFAEGRSWSLIAPKWIELFESLR